MGAIFIGPPLKAVDPVACTLLAVLQASQDTEINICLGERVLTRWGECGARRHHTLTRQAGALGMIIWQFRVRYILEYCAPLRQLLPTHREYGIWWNVVAGVANFTFILCCHCLFIAWARIDDAKGLSSVARRTHHHSTGRQLRTTHAVLKIPTWPEWKVGSNLHWYRTCSRLPDGAHPAVCVDQRSHAQGEISHASSLA
mmetsp:Transcript_27046/g.52200  ORF Transcript_27046/g.52200 Transcript_27046/m.52200 type:complete len:200 (+) Transcript_27046:492-1091(+)